MMCLIVSLSHLSSPGVPTDLLASMLNSQLQSEMLFVVDQPDQPLGGNLDDSKKELHSDCHWLREDPQTFLQEPL